MMMRSVLLRTLYERRSFILGWTLGLAAFAALMAVFYPSMRPEAGMQDLMQSMPAAFQGLIGDMEALNRFDTYLATQLFDIRGSILVGVMAVILGVGLSTRQEESGELRTTLAQPISRGRYFIEQWLAMVVIIAIITVVGLGAGVYMMVPFIEGAALELAAFGRIIFMTVLVMTVFATVSFAAGMISGRRSAATLAGTLVLALSFVITTFSAGVEWLRDFEPVSLLYYFQAIETVSQRIIPGDVMVLGGLLLLLLAVSLLVFRRRDIN